MPTFKGRKPTGRCPQFSRMCADRCLDASCLRVDISPCFQGDRVHASGKWSSTTGAPPRTVHLEEIKSRLAPIDLRGVYFLRFLM